LVVLAVLAVIPSSAYAQASVAGVVRDTSGAVLPGVTVEVASPALIEGVRSTVTDGSGRYLIEQLRPGDYTVTFSLAGFARIQRDGIQLSGTSVTTVNADMRVGAIEETITVTGEAPIVDVQSTVSQRVLDQDVLEALPSSRAPAQVAALMPNVTTATQDVGGSMGDGSSRGGVVTRGNGDSRILIGGLMTQTGSGTSHGIYNMEAYQEVLIDTGAVSAEYYTGGVRINFVPKDGGNTFAGSFLTAFANNSMSGDNVTDELRAAGLEASSSIKQLFDINPSFGGPIVQDKVWFHTAGRYNRAYNYASIRFNKNAGNPNEWTYEPDLSREPAASENWIRNFNGRVTWQATPRNKFAGFYDHSKVCDCPRTLTATSSPEAAIGQYNINPRRFYTGEWTSPVNSNLLLEASFVHIYSRATRARVNPFFDPAPVPMVQVQEQSTGINYRGTANSNESINTPTQIRGVASYVTGSHAFKVGFNWGTVNQSRETFSTDAPLIFRMRNAVPNRITQFSTPFIAYVEGVETAMFVQDRWTVGRFTVSGGVRYDRFVDSFPEQTIGPGNFTPNRNIQFAKKDGVSWNDIEPRLGLAVDVFGNGRTAYKVTLNKYLGGDGSGGPFGIGAAPGNNMITSTTRSWNDANRNYVPDCDLVSVLANGECGAMANRDFGTVQSTLAFDPDLMNGWGVRSNNWQFSTGLQQQLITGVSVSVDYWRTTFGNNVIVDHTNYDASDFDTYSITAPRDPRLPGGGGYVISGLYDVKPAVFGRPAGALVSTADKYGKMTEVWNGVDFNFNVRPQGGVLLQGGTTTQRQSTDTCGVVGQVAAAPPPDRGGNPPPYNPSQLFCDVNGTFLTQLKFLASYTIPRIDVRVSASMQNLPGPQITASYAATNAIVSPSLGRPLAGGAANVEVPLVEPRSMYGDRWTQLDLRFGKLLQLGRYRANVGVDIYNALNSSGVLELSDAFDTWQRPTSILSARFAKLVFQLNF
jgi:hypothetical protein